MDSATHGAGNMLAHGAFGTSKSIVSGNTPSVASGEVYVEFTASTGLSNYAALGFLDRMFRNQAFTVSANHVGLTTAVPTDANTGSTITEVSGGSYARVAVNVAGGASPAWNAPSSSTVTNANAVTFPTATGSWGTITSMVVCDASTAGNLLWYGDVTDQLVGPGDTVSFASSQISLAQS